MTQSQPESPKGIPNRSKGLADRVILGLVRAAGLAGATGGELADEQAGRTRPGAQGSLSRLHDDGMVERLAIRRDGSHIYVTPENVGGRKTQPYGWVSRTVVPGPGIRKSVTCPQCDHHFEVGQ